MMHYQRRWMAAVVALLAVTGCAASTAPTSTRVPTTVPAAATASSAQASGNCTLTVNITASGSTVWGTVTATDNGTTHTLAAASQVVSVPCGTSVSLTQKPSSPSTWPFQGWQSSAASVPTPTAATIHLTVTGPTTVTAEYAAGSGGASATKAWG
jgi:hypothetical protein